MTIQSNSFEHFSKPVYETAAVRAAEWLTTNQVARLLQISPSSLEKARSTGSGPLAKLSYHKIGRSVRYLRADVQAFLEDMRIAGTASSKRGE